MKQYESKMKREKRRAFFISLCGIALCLVMLCPFRVKAEKMWNEDFYRASDSTGDLSEAQRNELDKLCLEFMKTYHLDLSLLAVTSERREGMTLEEMGRQYYKECGFGYSLSYDGFQMVWDVGSGEVCIVPMGDAADKVDEDYLSFIEKTVPEYQEQYGTFGPFYGTYGFLDSYLKDVAENKGQPESDELAEEARKLTDQSLAEETGDPETEKSLAEENEEDAEKSSESEASAQSLPEEKEEDAKQTDGGADSEDTKTLPGESTVTISPEEKGKRVVDRAGLFSKEECAEMEEYLKVLTEQLEKDIVIFTDVTSGGQEHKIYAADFYDYGGYGFGPQFEGVCLFVCMDPEDRGWWCCCTGSRTMGLYTEEIANQIDDMLYPYMKAGNYYEGIRDWIENIRRMYETGSPYLESWAMESADKMERTHDESVDRVVDDAGLLNLQQIKELEQKVKKLASAYNVDIAIHTIRDTGVLELSDYAERYYTYKGYGRGEDYKGILLTVQKNGSYTPHLDIRFFGDGFPELTDEGMSRLSGRTLSLIREEKYEKAFDLWSDMTENYLKTGRVPRSALSWSLTLLFSMLVGLIIGGILLSRAKASMKTPAIQENADPYLVPGTLFVGGGKDTYLSSTSTRRYDPPSTSSSSSSSRSSSSSYSSHYSGSSGRSHSGSGRSF